MTRGRTKPLFTPIKRNVMTVPGMHGGYLQSTEVEPMEFIQPIAFIARDDETALDLKDELAEWLITDEPVELQFDDEPGRTYFALVQNTIEDFERISILRQGSINFLCLDPYGYSDEKPFLFPSDAVNLTNAGTADADPVFELEVLKPVTFAMVQNQNEEYMMIGRPLSVSEEVVNTRTLLLEERGQTLDSWASASTSVDGGVVVGNLSTDNDGITVPNYGTGDKWHGPALIKEVPVAQDFEVEMMLEGRFASVNQTYRVEFYLFDENMNPLGKMAIVENSVGITKVKAEGRIGPFLGRQQNYLISGNNYEYNWRTFYGMLRMRRVGNAFEFYVTRVNNENKHVYTLSKKFIDANNEFSGQLKYVQIHIGKFADTPKAANAKINHIKVYELTQATEDQTPYIAQTNDVITFDHVNDEILINGEDRKDLKDFGASYFQLAKGGNALVVHPDDSFETRVKYRNRYR